MFINIQSKTQNNEADLNVYSDVGATTAEAVGGTSLNVLSTLENRLNMPRQ